MRRRVLPVAAAAALIATVTLTGCTVADSAVRLSDDCVPMLQPGALSDSVEVSGDSVDSLRVSLLENTTNLNSQRSITQKAENRDRVATEGAVVTGNVAYVDARTGEVLDASPTFLQGSASEIFLAGSANPFSAGLLCAAPGDLVSIVLSAEDSALFNYLDGELLLIAEISEVSGVHAAGKIRALPSGFPAVTTTSVGRPGIVLPPQEAPTESRDAARIAGDGAVVTADQLVIGHALTVNWNGEIERNTWDTMLTSFGAEADAQASFRAALTGYPVGSQVVVIEANGEGGASVSVVDILAVL